MNREEIFMKVLLEFLSKSKEDLHKIDNDEPYDNGIFSTFNIDGDDNEDFSLR